MLLVHSKEEKGKSCSCLASLSVIGLPMTGDLHRKCYLRHQQHLAQLVLQGGGGGGGGLHAHTAETVLALSEPCTLICLLLCLYHSAALALGTQNSSQIVMPNLEVKTMSSYFVLAAKWTIPMQCDLSAVHRSAE